MPVGNTRNARNAQNLDMTIKRTTDGAKFPTVRIWADPDDTPHLHELFTNAARELGNHDNTTRWLNRYEARIVPVSNPHRAILIAGLGGDPR